MRKLTVTLSIVLILHACGRVENAPGGVTVRTGDGQKVRVTAVTDNIFRISAVPGNSFPDTKSLCVVEQSQDVKYDVTEDENTVTVSTVRASAVISKCTGAVSFFDAQGNLILAEESREFSPIEVEGTSAYTVRQVFKANEDEGYYGLGQHQADEWNYKGKNEELYQYNTKISIPFIVSSKGYGVLWDSYSFCRWGDVRDYAQLGEVFKLYNKDGKEGSLTGTYVPRQGSALIREEPAINQEFLRTPECDIVKNSPEGFNFGGSNVTFEGEIEPSESGQFNFLLYYAGYTKVFFGGKEVVPEIWRTAWNPNSAKFSVDLKAGVRTPVRIEWKPDGGVSYCALKVLSPVDEAERQKMSWWGEMQDQIDYYFIAGDNIDGAISGYRTLTGKAQIMPRWAMGYWQSRERYHSQEELLQTLSEFRKRNIPIDNIVQDWQYWEDDAWGSHEFDASRYPDPKGMVDKVHQMDARIMISVWPKFYTTTEHFKELDANGWIYQTAVKDSVEDWLGFQQSFYDAYAEGARKLFWQQMKDHLFPLGFDSWWMDASEPNIHDCTDMDYRKAMCGPTALGPSTQYFNAYALMNAQAIYEGQREADPDRRVFLLTRNGFAGLQRYSTASWSGDIGTRWEDMKTQISAGLNFCLSGIPFWTQDVGGFSVENRYVAAQAIFEATGVENEDLKEWRELQMRWHQWGIYNPLYRAHGQFPLREPWNIAPAGHPAYENIVEQDCRRYRLMPYIYSLDARVHFDDYTMMRALVMDWPDDAVAREISDEFLFGDAILVCPVYKYKARSREVYLPEGGWYDANDRCKFIQGGRKIVTDAPVDKTPTYFRAGSIVPEGSAIQSTANRDDHLRIRIFAGADASFNLYDDDGVTYNYEKGEYANIPMEWNDASRTLTIGAREGSFDGMIGKYWFLVMLNTPDGEQVKPVVYDGGEVKVLF